MQIWDKTRGFLEDTAKELKRTSWPTRNEVQGTTLVVLVTVLIVAFYLGLVDLVLGYLQRLVLFRGGMAS